MSYGNYGSNRYGSSGYVPYNSSSRRTGTSSYSNLPSSSSYTSRRSSGGSYGLLPSVSSYLSANTSPRSSVSSGISTGYSSRNSSSPRNSKSYDYPLYSPGSKGLYKTLSAETERSPERSGYSLKTSKSASSIASDLSDSSLCEGLTERTRMRYGSSVLSDESSEVSSKGDASSRYSSLSCSRSSLNDDDKDYRKLYEEVMKENERLKVELRKAEEELERTKREMQKVTQATNTKNSISETEKKERRALERKISEMEEDLKNISKLKAENEKLKAENRALSRVVCKLSK